MASSKKALEKTKQQQQQAAARPQEKQAASARIPARVDHQQPMGEQAQIPRKIDELSLVCQASHNILSDFEQKLQPVLRAQGEADYFGAASAKKEEELVPVAAALDQIIHQADVLNHRIANLMARLQL